MKLKPKTAFKQGDIKICKGFALFPTKINRDITVWLEFYTRHKMFFFGIGISWWSVYDPIRRERWFVGGKDWTSIDPPVPLDIAPAVLEREQLKSYLPEKEPDAKKDEPKKIEKHGRYEFMKKGME